MPPKPNMAATTAIIKNPADQRNIVISLKFKIYLHLTLIQYCARSNNSALLKFIKNNWGYLYTKQGKPHIICGIVFT
jgi:hypothetical protein